MVRHLSRRRVLIASGFALAAPALAHAQSFPSRAIKLVVPYPPGGPVDALARIATAEMQATLGQNVIVENQPGAAGSIGTRSVARSDPDGHTLIFGTNQTHCTNAWLVKDAGYDPVRDFVPVAGLADLQHVLVVRKDFAATSASELVSIAKADPGKLNYGSTGLGSGSHLAMELFRARTGTVMQHIPFTGAAPMANEIVAGRIDLAFATLPSVLGLISGGEMRAIGLASGVVAPQLASAKLLRDQGIADAEADAWIAVFAPVATPSVAREKLTTALLNALRKPAIVETATKLGFAVNTRDSAAFTAYQATEMTKWAAVVAAAGLKVQ